MGEYFGGPSFKLLEDESLEIKSRSREGRMLHQRQHLSIRYKIHHSTWSGGPRKLAEKICFHAALSISNKERIKCPKNYPHRGAASRQGQIYWLDPTRVLLLWGQMILGKPFLFLWA